MTYYFDLTAYEEAEYNILKKEMLGNSKDKKLKDIERHNYLRNKKNKYLKQIGKPCQ